MPDFLREHPCVDCGEPDPRVLDFDHVGEKRELVSSLLARGATWKRIEAEIAQCEVRNLNHVHGILALGSCTDCGEADMLVLEFDHVGVKRGQVSQLAFNVSLATLKREIAECEIRCCNCHRRVTAERRALAREPRSTVSGGPP